MPEVKDLGLANNEIVSVTRTSGTGQPGSVDTYTIAVRDGTTFTFNVTNGNNGLSGLSRQEFTNMAAFTMFLNSNKEKIACIVYRYLDGDSINHYHNVVFGLGSDAFAVSTKFLKYMDNSGNWQSITTLSENNELSVYYFENAAGVSVVPTSRTIAGLSLESDIAENALFDKMSIKGRYATLTALQTADPNHGYCYLVEENNHWYYWNGSAWADGGVYNSTAFESVIDDVFVDTEMQASATSLGWRLVPETGLCASNESYKLVKYTVTAGKSYKVVSDDYFQFQTVVSVPSHGTSNRIGDTYATGTYYVTAPVGATYLIFSTPTTDSTAKAYEIAIDPITKIKTALYNDNRIIYTTSTARHSYSAVDGGKCLFHVGAGLNVKLSNDVSGSDSLAWKDISSDISDAIVITDGKAADITIDPYCSLVYNTTDKLLHLRNLRDDTANHIDDVLLVANTWGKPVKGVLWDEYIDRKVIDGDVTEIKTALYNDNRIIYTTSTARHSYSAVDGGKCLFHVGAGLNVRLSNDVNLGDSLAWKDISSDISDAIVITDGEAADITIDRYCSLVYNTTDKLLHLRNLLNDTANHIDDVLLVANTWGNPVKGVLWDEYIDRKVIDDGGRIVTSDEILAQSFNSAYHVGATNFADKCTEFASLLCGTTDNDYTAPIDFESFLFFTDPHLAEGTTWQPRCYEYIAQIQKYYNSTPTTFCICGGDWLGNSDLPETACFKLGYIDGFMHSMFDRCYMIAGNHDTNYQGKKDEGSAKYTTRLTNQSIVDLWYREGKKAYYSFDGANTRFYCFDTGTEGQTLGMYDNYGWKQAQWFANALLTDNHSHIAIVAHILYDTVESMVIHPLADKILEIAEAYNNRTTINVNGTSYDYSGKTGKVDYALFGHTHDDYTFTIHNIPCVITTWVRAGSNSPTFDLVLADYDNRQLKFIRVGSGENRTINMS